MHMCPLLHLEGFRMTHRLRSIQCSGCSGRRLPPLFICLLGQEQLARYTRAFGLSVQALTSGGEREGVRGSRRKEIHSSKKRQGGSNCRLPCAGETKAFIAFVLLIYKWDTLLVFRWISSFELSCNLRFAVAHGAHGFPCWVKVICLLSVARLS